MPCYRMNLLNLEFNVANLDYLQLALRELGFEYEIIGEANLVLIKDRFNDPIRISLIEQRVECTRTQMTRVNEIKQEYSRQVITEVARRKRWVVKAQTKNKLKLRRF